MEKLKRLRFCRTVASVLVPLISVPVWFLTAAPSPAQEAPPPPSIPGQAAPAPPPPGPAPSAEGTGTTAAIPTLTHGSLLVWTLDVSRVAPGNPALGITAAQDIVTAFAGNTVWQAGLLKPDLQEDSPSVKRAIQADTSGKLVNIVDSPNQPSPEDAEYTAHTLGYDAVLLGQVLSLQNNQPQKMASATIAATIYDARQPGIVRQIGGERSVSGDSGHQRGAVSVDTLQAMALQSAAAEYVRQLTTPPGTAPGRGSRANGGKGGTHFSFGKLLPILVGAAALGIIVAVASNNGNNNHVTSQNNSLFPAPQNAIATQAPNNGAIAVDLQFNASSAGAAVQKYVITRHGGGGDTVIDSLPAQGAGPVFQTVDSSVMPGQTYSYTVQAVGYNGQVSTPVPFNGVNGQPNFVVGKPAPPTTLNAQIAGTSVVLTWSPSPDAGFVTGYQVLRSPAFNGPYAVISPQINATTFTDSSSTLAAGGLFYYSVQAISNVNPPVLSDRSAPIAVQIPHP